MAWGYFVGTPARFHISEKFADMCENSVGGLVVHENLGVLRCEEVVVAADDATKKVIFRGTADVMKTQDENKLLVTKFASCSVL